MPDDTASLEQLRAIRHMIAETRRSTTRHWVYLFVWGVLGAVASVVSQFMITTAHERALPIVWAVYVATGAVTSLLLGRREERRTRIRTFAGRVLSVAWTAIGVTIVLFCVAAVLVGAAPVQFLPGLIALLLAAGLCVMGALLEFGVLYAAAVLWWAGGLVMLLRPREAFAVQTALLVLGYLAPAEMLRRQMAADDVLD